MEDGKQQPNEEPVIPKPPRNIKILIKKKKDHLRVDSTNYDSQQKFDNGDNLGVGSIISQTINSHLREEVPAPPLTLKQISEENKQRRKLEARRLTLEAQRIKIDLEYEEMTEEILKKEGKPLIFSNQKKAADEVVRRFKEGKRVVLLIALPGQGKTGVILEVIRQLLTLEDSEENNRLKCVLIEDMVLTCGMADIEWVSRMKEILIPLLRNRVYHRGELPANKGKLSEVSNGLICTDESHIGAGMKQKTSEIFAEAGLYNVSDENTTRILEVSATPGEVKAELEAWGSKACVVKLEPSPSYKGFKEMLDEGRIHDSPNIETKEKVTQFVKNWQNRFKLCPTKKYFPIRLQTKSSEAKQWFKDTAALKDVDWEWFEFDSDHRHYDIDVKMQNAPKKHTIIFIKGFWRASKRIERKHIGGSFEEPPRKQNTTTTAQGLIARFCNTYEYDDDEIAHPEWRPLHYGDVSAIRQYLACFNSGFDFEKFDYSSTKLKSKGGKVTKKDSKVNHAVVKGLTVVPVEESSSSSHIVSPHFASRAAAEEWARMHINYDHKDFKISKKPRDVFEYNVYGDKMAVEGKGTHMKDGKGIPSPIPCDTTLPEYARHSQLVGSELRLIPIHITSGGDNKYVLLFKPDWLKTDAETDEIRKKIKEYKK